jgi:hypothetical protein
MKSILFSASLLFVCASAWGQSPKKAVQQLGPAPIYFVDSVKVTTAALQQYDPQNIAAVSVYKNADATRLVGARGKDGVVYAETKPFATRRFKRYFAHKSAAYAQLLTKAPDESAIQYVLNGKPLTTDYEGDLSLIDDQTFQHLEILDHAGLQQRYPSTNKTYGVVVTSRVPKDLYHGRRKF